MSRYIFQITVFLCVLLLGAIPMYGQSYNQSAGVRFGHSAGITYKKFVVPEEAVEFMISGRRQGAQVTLMYVNHKQMEFSFNENFYAYYGLGGHFGLERYNDLSKTILPGDPPTFEFEEKSYFVMGADAIIGLEYRWLSIPITIGFDVKPYINYIGMRYLRSTFWDASLSFKYIF